MFVAIAFNAVSADAPEDERDVLVEIAAVRAALDLLGHRYVLRPVTLDLAGLADSLRKHRPDIVFNLVESLDSVDALAPCAAAAIEQLGLPLTGSRSDTLWLSNHKPLAKQFMRSARLPTPDWFDPVWAPFDRTKIEDARTGSETDDSPDSWHDQRFIVKPRSEHASFGMDESSIIQPRNQFELGQLVEQHSHRLGQPCFAEKYIDGREFNVSLLARDDDCEVLPLAEIDFSAFGNDKPRIVDYKAKWATDSFEYRHTSRTFLDPAVDVTLQATLRRLARHCWQVFHLSGYARVDFRVSADGQPWILEVNTNPCLSPDAGFAAALESACISFPQAIARILADASGPPLPVEIAKSMQPKGHPSSHDDLRRATPDREAAGGIRWRYEARAEDAQQIRNLVAATEFFYPDEIDVAEELVVERLNKGPASGYHFVFADLDQRLIGYACYGPIACTRDSYDLYWIAVHPDAQRGGNGRRILAQAEELIRRAGGRRVYIETSNRPQYASTRSFYERCGYSREATLAEFYGPGDDKVVYAKRVDQESPGENAATVGKLVEPPRRVDATS